MQDSFLYRWRRVTRVLPRSPRCKVCNVPFRGFGRVFRLLGFAPSRKSSSLCNSCFERAPLGGSEMEIGVLFADVRGFSSLAETKPPEEVADLLGRFYRAATDVLLRHDAIIDKLVGDEVMALFIPPLIGDRHLEKMVDAGEALMRSVGFGTAEGPWLPLGVGADFDTAFVGNVGGDEVMKDFTALGDVVNTAERLQSHARPGQLVLSERVYQALGERFPDAQPLELELKGKSVPVRALIIDVGANAPPAG